MNEQTNQSAYPPPIPCSERLPENGQRTLFFCTEWILGTFHNTDRLIGWDDGNDYFTTSVVSHWMPAPPTPEGG